MGTLYSSNDTAIECHCEDINTIIQGGVRRRTGRIISSDPVVPRTRYTLEITKERREQIYVTDCQQDSRGLF